MKTILKTRKLWDIIENRVTVSSSSENTPALPERERWSSYETYDGNANTQIAISDVIFPRIAPTTSSKDAWNAWKMEFQRSSQVKMINLQSLRKEYENLKMSESDSINTFSTKLIDMGNQLRIHGEEKSDTTRNMSISRNSQ